MALRLPLASLVLAAATSTLACSAAGAGDRVGSDESNHTEGDPSVATHAWLWANETREEYEAASLAAGATGNGWLPSDAAITKRLQFWVDRMDDHLRTTYPEKVRNTPKPVIVVQDSPDANAWVTPISVAWSVPSRITTDAATATVPAALELLISGIVTPSAHVIERPHASKDVSTFVDFFNRSFQGCRLTEEGKTVAFGEGCIPYDTGTGSSTQLAFSATAKHVTITTAYLRTLGSEEVVLTTLAHELGHFYGAHASVPTDVFNYFYSLDENLPKQPEADARFATQTAQLRDKLRVAAFGGIDFSEENALMTKERLGIYTAEQEADEISLELLAHVGIAPEVAIDKHLLVLAWYESQAPADGLSAKECSVLREKGFKDDAGTWVSVPVGDASDTHHSFCFRAFNVAREIEAHAYSVSERVQAPGDDWATLMTTLP